MYFAYIFKWQELENKMTETENKTEQGTSKSFSKLYDRYYKLLLIIPAILLILSLGYLFYFYSQNNDILHKDVSLTGGTTVTVYDSNINIPDLEGTLGKTLNDFSIRTISDLRTGKQIAVVIQTTSSAEQTQGVLEDYLKYKTKKACLEP